MDVAVGVAVPVAAPNRAMNPSFDMRTWESNGEKGKNTQGDKPVLADETSSAQVGEGQPISN